jgi:hypothetical protein
LNVIFLERRPSEPKRARMQAKRMEMTVSSTVTRAPREMNQNQSLMTLALMRPLPAWPWESYFQVFSTLAPVVVTITTLKS